MSRIERLLNLTAALLNAERLLSAEQLRERVPGYPEEKTSFRRQFERDKDALRELGLPLTMEQLTHDSAGAQFGYRIVPDDYYLRDPGLAPDELSALHLAARVVRVEGLEGLDAQWKLGRPETLTQQLANPTNVDEHETFVPVTEALASIFSAIADKRTVEFGYRGELRIVEPGQLSFRNGHWYLGGFDTTRADDRSFRVDRIVGDVQIGALIEGDRSTSSLQSISSLRRPWEIGEEAQTTALVCIDSDQALWALAHLGEEAIDSRGLDGSITFRLLVRNRDAFRSFLLGFLDRAEVLAPTALRDQISLWLRAMVDT